MANLAGVCREKQADSGPICSENNDEKFYAKAILSQGTPIWSFMGK